MLNHGSDITSILAHGRRQIVRVEIGTKPNFNMAHTSPLGSNKILNIPEMKENTHGVNVLSYYLFHLFDHCYGVPLP